MIKEKETFINFILMAFLAALPSVASAQGLIIELPGQKQIEKASATVKINKTPAQQKRPSKGETLLPLPAQIKKPVKPAEKKEPEGTESGKDNPLIKITPPKPEKAPDSGNNFPAPPDEIVITPGDSLGNLLPDQPPPEVSVSSNSPDQTMPVFPKDTSSAIFMVMKTWQCSDYDGNELLRQAVEVYGKEADDAFQIQGLSSENTGDFNINVEEEDITLDELLDILASKSGRDWGVDIPSKTIYFYPKGVKTEAFNVW